MAVSVYGLYQAGVELPELQVRRFVQNKAEALAILQIEPGTPEAMNLENRLLRSNEPYSTFALANSLAGFLVGPLVLMLALVWDGLTRREGKGSRLAALRAPRRPRFWRSSIASSNEEPERGRRTRCRARARLEGTKTAQCEDAGVHRGGRRGSRRGRSRPGWRRAVWIRVLTQSGKSFGYRQEYWVGTWPDQRVVERLLAGLRARKLPSAVPVAKLPEASEEIKDPHNLFLEVWATGGLWAAVTRSCFGGTRLGNMLRPSPGHGTDEPRPGFLRRNSRDGRRAAPPTARSGSS